MIGILDVDSWHIILNTLQKTEILFSKIKLEIQPQLSPLPMLSARRTPSSEQNAIKKLVNQEDENVISLDLQILGSALDSLFAYSQNYPVSDPFFHLLIVGSINCIIKCS